MIDPIIHQLKLELRTSSPRRRRISVLGQIGDIGRWIGIISIGSTNGGLRKVLLRKRSLLLMRRSLRQPRAAAA